jgi:hypothetical protein
LRRLGHVREQHRVRVSKRVREWLATYLAAAGKLTPSPEQIESLLGAWEAAAARIGSIPRVSISRRRLIAFGMSGAASRRAQLSTPARPGSG